MLSDAHCHPFDLKEFFPRAEEERRGLGLVAAASATGPEEFADNEKCAKEGGGLLLCYALHPQLPAHWKREGAESRGRIDEGLAFLDSLARDGRLDAVGEAGFDLYTPAFRETEKTQDEIFAAHLETALAHDLPLVIHARRAMHKIFANIKPLKKCRAVIFHSWPGTAGEGASLLERGVNAYFSFGAALLLNHREAMRSAAVFPACRLLTETDAPYQPLRGRAFSCWQDLPLITSALAGLRREAGLDASDPGELEHIARMNFRAAFGA